MLPVIETYTLNETFTYEEIKTIAEVIFGDQISVSKKMTYWDPEFAELFGEESTWRGDYEIKLDNQKNAKFDSYVMSEYGRKFTENNDENSTIKRNIEYASDFEHFFLFSYDDSVNNLTLEYYDKDLNQIWIIIPTTLLPVMIGFLSGCILMKVSRPQIPKEERL